MLEVADGLARDSEALFTALLIELVRVRAVDQWSPFSAPFTFTMF